METLTNLVRPVGRARLLLPGALILAGLAISGCAPLPGGGVDSATAEHASALEPEPDETVWNLVALSDSTPAGVGSDYSYVQVYAGYIEQDRGVTVNVHNYATGSLRGVADWAEEVRSNEYLRNDLRNAQVITMWLGSHDMLRAVGAGRGGPCYPRAGEVHLDCLREMTDRMQEGFDLLLSEIVALASPDESLILIADVGIPPPMFRSWKEDSTFDLLKRHAYEAWRDHLIQAARKHRVHVVPTYEALNGPHGDRATPPEYLQSDGTHLNEQGHRWMADIHRSVGYEYSDAGSPTAAHPPMFKGS